MVTQKTIAVPLELFDRASNSKLANLKIAQLTPTAPLQKVKAPTPNKCPGYDTKQSDGEVPVMLELWRIWSIPSLLSLPDPLLPGVLTPDRVLSMGQIELN